MLSKNLQIADFIERITKRRHLSQYPVRAQYNKILRESFDSAIEVLGYSGKSALIDQLERNGSFSRYDDSYLSLWRIGQGLQELFGQEIAEMIMEKVMINMDRLYTLQQARE